MPLSFWQTFLTRREFAQRQGWPVPPLWKDRQARSYYESWLEYWHALLERAEREGWPLRHPQPTEMNDGKPAPQDHRLP